MKQLITFFIAFLSAINSFAQMETDGDNPEAIYKKFPYQFQYTAKIDFVRGDMGWFDFYTNDFMIDHTGRMWIAGNHGLSYSDDKGLKWHLSTSRWATFSIFETRNHTLLCSSTNEFVMRSDNRGQAWKHNRVRDVGTGRSSHGERYDDIFYVQVDDKRIIRTCQYGTTFLISDDDGITWRKSKLPEEPESIVNLGDSLLVMFTYDQMYLSTDRADSWQIQTAGLPQKRNAEKGDWQGVIDCGVTMSDGTIMALVESQEEGVYEHAAYFFDLKSRRWIRDGSNYIYTWGQSAIYDGGDGRLLTYDHNTWEMSVSFDKGRTWGVMYKADHTWAFPFKLSPDGNNVYFIQYTEVAVMHFPALTTYSNVPEQRKTFRAEESENIFIDLFGVNPVVEQDEALYSYEDEPPVFAFQLSAGKGIGYSKFLLHLASDTTISEVYILHRGNGAVSVEYTFELDTSLKAGDYELWFYNQDLAGCYFLEIVLDSTTEGELLGCTGIFY